MKSTLDVGAAAALFIYENNIMSSYIVNAKAAAIKSIKIKHLPGLPRKTEEYKTRLDGSLARVSGGDDHSLRHHRPVKEKK